MWFFYGILLLLSEEDLDGRGSWFSPAVGEYSNCVYHCEIL